MLGHQWDPDLACIRSWNSFFILWLLGWVKCSTWGKFWALASASSTSLMLTWSICLLCKILASMQALNLCTPDLWLWRACLKVSLALWCVFSITEVQPTWLMRHCMITWASAVPLIKSCSFSKKHTLVMDSFRKCMASIPGMCSPMQYLFSSSRMACQSSCMFSFVSRILAWSFWDVDHIGQYLIGGLKYCAAKDMDLLASNLVKKSKCTSNLFFFVLSEVAWWG